MGNIADLAGCLVTFGMVGKNLSTGDYALAGAGLPSAAGQFAKWYGANWGSEKVKKFMGGEAQILEWTIFTICLLELLNGFGPPDKGDKLVLSKKSFQLTWEKLDAAYPDDRWQGSGSEAYAEQDEAQQVRADAMVALEDMMVNILKTEADQLYQTRVGVTVVKDALTAAIFVALALLLIPEVGPTISQAFQIVMSFFGLGAVVVLMMVMMGTSFTHGHEVDAVTLQYRDLAASAVPGGKPFTPTVVSPAVESGVSSFSDIINSCLVSGVPDMSALAGVARDSKDERASLSAPMGAGERLGNGSPGATPQPETSDMPASTMPTLVQLTQMSGLGGRVSEQLSQPRNLVDKMMGHVQQVASMTRQGRGATAPAEEDLEGAEAAWDTGAAGRAPIDDAGVGPEQAQRPSPAQRIE